MEYELNDQDRAEIVKKFFKKYGLWIIVAVVVIAIGFGINAYMQKREALANQNASVAYDALFAAAQNGATVNQTTQAATDLIKNYPGTVYATFANLLLANIAVQQGNLGEADQILTAVLKSNDHNTLSPLIRLRLARVLIAENKPDDAVALLKHPPKGFEASYSLVTGDALLSQNNQAAAKASYLAAQAVDQNDPVTAQMITERLNSLSGNS